MSKFNEEKALSVVKSSGVNVGDVKCLTISESLNGLNACSALDYLVKHCGYHAIYKIKE